MVGRLRVLLVTTSYPTDEGSFEGVFVEQLAQALARRANVWVLAPHAPGLAAREWRRGVRVIRFRYAPPAWECLAYGDGGIPETLRVRPLSRLLVGPFLASFAAHSALLARHRDVIHANWAVSGVAAGMIRCLHGTPVVTTLRGSDLRQGQTGPGRWILDRAIRRSAAVTSVSRHGMQGVPANRAFFTPNGVRVPTDSPIESGPGPYRFIFIGSLTGLKGVDVLVDAFTRIPEQKRGRLTVVGDGAERAALEARARQLGTDAAIRFTGRLPHDAALRELKRADCLVLPSRSEGRPNVLLEAMAAGKPFLASDIPGCRELTDPGRNGLLHRPGDAADLAQQMERLAGDPELAARLGRGGPDYLREHALTWDACADRYLDVFGKVTQRPCAASSV